MRTLNQREIESVFGGSEEPKITVKGGRMTAEDLKNDPPKTSIPEGVIVKSEKADFT